MTDLDHKEQDRIKQIISRHADSLDEVNLALFVESAGVAQATDALRSALDKVDQCLDSKNYEKVADLGYRDVSSEFIFLQRTMAVTSDKAFARVRVVQEIAEQAKVAYEDVEKLVTEWSQGRKLKFEDS